MIICGDALEEMKKMKDHSVDLVITSPPYNIKNSSGNGLKTKAKGRWGNSPLIDGYAGYDDNMPHDLYVEWQRECMREMMRIIPDTGAIFYNHKWRVQNGRLQDRQDIVDGFPVRQIIIWQRAGGVNFNDSFFLPTYEVIYLIAKENFKLKRKANAVGDIWRFPQDTKNKHPAPMPLPLAERIINSVEAKTIFDPFAGSGTTGVACKIHDKQFIGVELNQEYVNMAVDRIENTQMKVSLGDLL